MKKILVLSGSPRIKGNSDLICDEFTRGAKEAENDVEKIHVASKKIAPCLACYYCREHHGECVQKRCDGGRPSKDDQCGCHRAI